MTGSTKPALTVDVALIARRPAPSILLIERGHEPFTGCWALPGGFVDAGERVHDAAARELAEETGVTGRALTLLGVYDTPGRDPRGWSVSVAFLEVIAERIAARGGDDARSADWFELDTLPPLAFDHELIVAQAAARIS
ncbi:MAG: NUDIX hydrolase [Solirubrobacteraceae bacterium]|jgi:8-oxo-dGTP diphosphatase